MEELTRCKPCGVTRASTASDIVHRDSEPSLWPADSLSSLRRAAPCRASLSLRIGMWLEGAALKQCEGVQPTLISSFLNSETPLQLLHHTPIWIILACQMLSHPLDSSGSPAP